jgi:hypothetical protein
VTAAARSLVATRSLAAAALILVAGCTALPNPPSHGPTTPSASPGASLSGPPTTTSPTAVASPLTPPTGDWQRVWPTPDDREGFLMDAIATRAGFVAVGADSLQRPFALSSADGASWTSEVVPGRQFGPAALISWGDQVLGVASGGLPCAHPFGVDTWIRSADASWTEAAFDELFCSGASLDAVIVDDAPIVVGTGPGDNPVAWSSTDGLRWVDHSQVFAGLLPHAVATDGQTAVAFGEGGSGIWTSTTADGHAWSPTSPIPGTSNGIVIHAAFWIGGRPTVIASEGRTVGTIQSDGNGGWTTQPADTLDADQLGTIRSDGTGLLAVGGVDTAAMAWVSSDGVRWRRLVLPDVLGAPNASVQAVAIRDERAILLGSILNPAGNPVSAVWVGPADLVSP